MSEFKLTFLHFKQHYTHFHTFSSTRISKNSKQQFSNYFTKREIIQSYGESRHLSTIPLKDFHLFKIIESVIGFYFKKISNSAILNKCESFNGIVDHVTCPPCGSHNFSYQTPPYCKCIFFFFFKISLFCLLL